MFNFFIIISCKKEEFSKVKQIAMKELEDIHKRVES